jgi:rhodanese-related sulfurtransferase
MMMTTPVDARVVDLDVGGLQALMAAGVPVIDIRREDEWEGTGIIPGTHLLTFFDAYRRYDLAAWLAGFDRVADRQQPFALVCRNGVRTRRLGRYLQGVMGWPSVSHLAGGLTLWIAAAGDIDLPPE